MRGSPKRGLHMVRAVVLTIAPKRLADRNLTMREGQMAKRKSLKHVRHIAKKK
jgi:hypothetical protein